MCGIAGIFRWNSATGPEDIHKVAAMNAALRHRGPDGAGVEAVDGRAVFGHTRLAILDLSDAAKQPMVSERIALTYNGEIYNFQDVRATLTNRSVTSRSTGDTEVLLHAVETFGAAAVERVDGMFAFAALDRAEKRLVLARDRCGKKPLYFVLHNDHVIFASELAALRAGGVDLRLDPSTLGEYLARGYIQPPRTACIGVEQVRPGEVVTIDSAGRVTRLTYWSHPWTQERRELVSDVEVASIRLRELFEDAVARRLMSDVPLGAFLSGGFDSAAVVSAAIRKTAALDTFTIGFDSPSWNESVEAAETSQLLGTHHRAREATLDSFDLLPRLVAKTGELQGDSSYMPTYMVSAFAREHVKVVLTGDGGDELFAGYDRFLVALAAHHSPRKAARLLEPLLHRLGTGPRALRRVRRLVHAAAVGPAATLLEWAGGATFSQVELLSGDAIDVEAMAQPELAVLRSARTNGAPPLHALLSANFSTYLPGNILVKLDRAAMAVGLEARSPFLDTALLEYASTLAPMLMARGLSLKWIAKRALAPLVPDVVRHRTKRGFGAPVGDWFRGPSGPALVDQLVESPRLRSYLDRRAIQALCEEHVSRRDDAGPLLFRLMALDAWLEWA